jgi:hypothetical protein
MQPSDYKELASTQAAVMWFTAIVNTLSCNGKVNAHVTCMHLQHRVLRDHSSRHCPLLISYDGYPPLYNHKHNVRSRKWFAMLLKTLQQTKTMKISWTSIPNAWHEQYVEETFSGRFKPQNTKTIAGLPPPSLGFYYHAMKYTEDGIVDISMVCLIPTVGELFTDEQ